MEPNLKTTHTESDIDDEDAKLDDLQQFSADRINVEELDD